MTAARAAHLCLALALPLSGGCSRASPFASIERSIRAELPHRIGPAERYDVVVSRSASGLLAGRIPWIEIHGRHVHVGGGLNVDHLEVRLEGVQFNRSDHSVREIEQTSFQASIGAGSIVGLLRARRPDLRGLRVRLTQDQVDVRATPSVLGLGVPVEIEGRPVLCGSTAIDFEASRAAVLRLGLPEFIVRRLEARINPLIDLNRCPLPVSLTAVRVEGGQVMLSGTAALKP